MPRIKWLAAAIILFVPITAARAGGPGNDFRIEYQDQDCEIYVWQLMSWETLQPACSFWLYNEGPPTASEVKAFCGSELSTAWYKTAPSSPAGEAPDSGYYVLLDKIVFSTCKMASHLPPVKFNYTIYSNILDIQATEPLPNQEIIKIEGSLGGHPFECQGSSCQVIIIPTGPRGIEVNWWAVSSFSEHPTPTQTIYIKYDPDSWPVLVDSRHGTAAQRYWGSFQPLEVPAWLNPAAQPSSEGFAYLAGRLISSGQADPGDCPDYGLMNSGYASVCGLDQAWPMVIEYQNQLDQQITEAAAAQEIPGQLLKRVIAIESQFWPDQHINWGAAGEAGLGQLTHNGADTLLMWDSGQYEAVCRPLFGSECDYSYYSLDDWQRSALQNEIMNNPSLETLARAIRANAGQAGGIIRDITGDRPGAYMSHADLWRAALVNYNAGPGCLRAALRDLNQAGYVPSWGGLATSLGALCPAAVRYVEAVTTTPLPYQPITH